MSKIEKHFVEFGENDGKSLDFFVKMCYTIANIAVENVWGYTSGKENGDGYGRRGFKTCGRYG